MEINNETIAKGLEAVANLTKTAANVTDNKRNNGNNNRPPRTGDNLNQPHHQNVEVVVSGGTGSEPKQPVVIKEKPETHIHKHFPDNRALTDEECRIRELEIRLEHEEKERQREWEEKREKRLAEERKEREDYERKERRAAEKERRRRRYMVYGAIGAIVVGAIGLDYYTSTRHTSTRRTGISNGAEVKKVTDGISVDGKVE